MKGLMKKLLAVGLLLALALTLVGCGVPAETNMAFSDEPPQLVKRQLEPWDGTFYVERANNPAAEAFYRENEAFSGDRRMSAGMHELYTPSGAFVLRSEKPIREAVVSADVAFYLIGETIYRMHIGTGATDKLSGLSHIKMLVVISNNVVRWNIPSRPECYDMTVSEMLDYDENDTFPFICYEYNFNTGEVREISRNQVLAEFWASESATRSTSPDIPIQASYTLYGRTLPLSGQGKELAAMEASRLLYFTDGALAMLRLPHPIVRAPQKERRVLWLSVRAARADTG